MTKAYIWMWVGYFLALIVGIWLSRKMGRDNKFILWALVLGVTGYWLDAVFWHWHGWLVPRQRAGYLIETFLVGQWFTTAYWDVSSFLRPLLPVGLLCWIVERIENESKR